MTTAAGSPANDPQPILDAASILLVDISGAAPRLLMGQRQPGNVFLPDKWVFPGGRLETSDAHATPAAPLDPGDAHALLAGLPGRPPASFAVALAVAAVRELFEETGHALGLPLAPLGASVAAGMPGGAQDPWQAWHALGLAPSLASLRFLARAITPPGRTRRYDTRFFIAARTDAIEDAAAADGEFTRTGWFTFEEARALDLPIITRRILSDVEIVLQAPEIRGPVPFYYQLGEHYRRDLIARAPAPA